MMIAHIAYAMAMKTFFVPGENNKGVRTLLIVISVVFINGYAW